MDSKQETLSSMVRPIQKLSEGNSRIEQLQGKRFRKVVHFNRLKSCPKNIRLNGEGQRQHGSEPYRWQSLELPDLQPVGQNLHIVDDDDDDITVGTNLEKRQLLMGLQLLLTYSKYTCTCRYPRREHRVPTRYSYYVPISYVQLLKKGGDDVVQDSCMHQMIGCCKFSCPVMADQ